MKERVLVIEDDASIRKMLSVVLSAEGYLLTEAATARQGLLQAETCQADAVLLDLGLPDGDGVELTQRIRTFSRMPILVISARQGESQKVAALDAGADDYLTKPFGVGELLARLRAALRRAQAARGPAADTVQAGEIAIDFVARRVLVRGTEVHLTPNEYRVLGVLARNMGCVVTQQHLLREVWGPGSTQQAHYLRVYVNQLRQKLELDPAQPRHLLTEVGVGYRFVDAVSGAAVTP